jgi:outer membrane lipoprotein-sorting protein
MSLKKLVGCFAFFMLAMTSLMSGEAHAQVKSAPLIPEVNILRGDFEQVRYMKGFKNPLKSEGRFLVSKSDGVVWQGIKPFPSRILIRNSGAIVNLDQPKTKSSKNTKKPNAAMSKIMLAMLSGNETEMAKHFVIQRTETNGIWTLQLQPKGGMARVFSRVEVKGERYIHKVVMEEKSGDKTELSFSAVTEVPNTLSAEELKYFK